MHNWWSRSANWRSDSIQLGALDEDTPGLDAAVEIVAGPLERLPKLGVDGLAAELKLPIDEIETGLALVRSLDPKPGARLGGLGADTYISPDCVVWRQNRYTPGCVMALRGGKACIWKL